MIGGEFGCSTVLIMHDKSRFPKSIMPQEPTNDDDDDDGNLFSTCFCRRRRYLPSILLLFRSLCVYVCKGKISAGCCSAIEHEEEEERWKSVFVRRSDHGAKARTTDSFKLFFVVVREEKKEKKKELHTSNEPIEARPLAAKDLSTNEPRIELLSFSLTAQAERTKKKQAEGRQAEKKKKSENSIPFFDADRRAKEEEEPPFLEAWSVIGSSIESSPAKLYLNPIDRKAFRADRLPPATYIEWIP